MSLQGQEYTVLSISREDVADGIAGENDYRTYGPQWWPLHLIDEQMQAIAARLEELLKERRTTYWDALLRATVDVVDEAGPAIAVNNVNATLRKLRQE